MIRLGIALLIFFMLGALFIISNDALHLTDKEERVLFSREYRSWLSAIGDNLRQITGAVVASEWLPRSNQSINE